MSETVVTSVSVADLRIETELDLVNALALVTKAHPRTVRRWVLGDKPVLATTAYALSKAVEELGVAELLAKVRGAA